MIEQQAAEETSAGQPETAPARKSNQEQEAAPSEQSAEPEPEAGWVVRARAYNANHPDEVQLFNHATGYTCTVERRDRSQRRRQLAGRQRRVARRPRRQRPPTPPGRSCRSSSRGSPAAFEEPAAEA